MLNIFLLSIFGIGLFGAALFALRRSQRRSAAMDCHAQKIMRFD